MTPPELIITIKRIGPAERHEYEAILSRADNKAEICSNSFTFNPDLLIDMEPQWMLNKAVPRSIDDALRHFEADQHASGDRTDEEWNLRRAG